MNDFSMVCRVLGTLFYRSPQDAVLAPLMVLITEGKLTEHWPLEQDALLARLGKSCVPQALGDDFSALFAGETAKVPPFRSSWLDAPESDVRAFLGEVGMPVSESATDHFGALLLAASWLEDHAQQDEIIAQSRLFDEFLLPWSDLFLGKVEAHAGTDFYRVLAAISREALQAMREELAEESE
ncbi:molecular chaperone [Sodalis ligni]|uniref:TorD/DmsD family molecular chaperone n=1 Tax=Sodalis ligni TaxID=2697027 RepID=UPI00193F63F3|nr:molecular chaperone [Sodalis ligni]QWA09049.1 molecular chaperone [Sodalis ligni]